MGRKTHGFADFLRTRFCWSALHTHVEEPPRSRGDPVRGVCLVQVAFQCVALLSVERLLPSGGLVGRFRRGVGRRAAPLPAHLAVPDWLDAVSWRPAAV